MNNAITSIDKPATLSFLRARAAAAMAKYPQYAGHFDGYRLARMKRDVKTKMGQAFVKGEYVIAVESEPVFASNGVLAAGFRITAWSHLNTCDTAIKPSDLEWV